MTTTMDPTKLALAAARVAERTDSQKVRLESSETKRGKTSTIAAEVTAPAQTQVKPEVKPQTDTFQSAAQHVSHREHSSSHAATSITVSTGGGGNHGGGVMVSFNSGNNSHASGGQARSQAPAGEKSLFTITASA